MGGGGTITDTATVTGGPPGPGAPRGTVTFYECGPSAAASTCPATGTPYSSGPVTPASSSADTSSASSSPAFTPSGGAGWYCFSAVYAPEQVEGPENNVEHSVTIPYGGSEDNTTTLDPAECVHMLADPSITTVASPTSGVAGTALSNVGDTATLHNATSAPTGSITFALYSDSSCTTAVSGMSGSGAITTSTAGSTATWTAPTWTPSAAGTYYWKASYAGDTNNTVASACGGSGEQITVTAAVIAATPVTPAPPAPVAKATVVTTGEPFAGSKPIEAGVALLGIGLLTLGLLRRRNLRRGAQARTR